MSDTLNQVLASRGLTAYYSGFCRKDIVNEDGEVVVDNVTADQCWRFLNRRQMVADAAR